MGFGLPLAIVTAWVLARVRFPGRPILNALVHLPLVLPPVVTGWLLLIIFGLRGPIGSLLQDWFGVRLVFTTAGASLACAVMTFPVMVRSVRLSLESADLGLDQAARSLGAGRLDRLFNVTLPLASPGILVGAIVAYPCFHNPAKAFRFLAGDPLEPGPFGMMQPAKRHPVVQPDLVLVPLIAIDSEGTRLGRGKGHYDRALIGLKKNGARLIGIGWQLQRLADTIPADEWDVPLDAFASPDSLEWFGK